MTCDNDATHVLHIILRSDVGMLARSKGTRNQEHVQHAAHKRAKCENMHKCTTLKETQHMWRCNSQHQVHALTNHDSSVSVPDMISFNNNMSVHRNNANQRVLPS